MAKYETTIIGQFEDVVSHLQKDISNAGMSMNLVDESGYTTGDTKVVVQVYDKYFARNGNRASLSLTIVGRASIVFISAIGAGGGKGVFFNFSLGAEDDMVAIVQNSIDNMR